MTEQEWLECADPLRMLNFVDGQATSRQYRLFACGCCQRIRQLRGNRLCQAAVAVSERFADNLASDQELEAAWQAAGKSWPRNAGETNRAAILAAHGELLYRQHGAITAAQVADAAARAFSMQAKMAQRQHTEIGEKSVQASLVRCIFGTPFRPVTVDPAWLTSTVVSLASAIYADRAFDRMPILADALEDAGCTNADILNHCRQPGEHVRGCWALDLLLEKP